MRRYIIIIICFTVSVFALQAQNANLKKAGELYAKKDYHSAAELYEQTLSTEGVAPEIYYNLGNCYYKTGEIGKAILNYERALRLDPRFDDARYNLQIAQQKVVDNVGVAQNFFLARWLDDLIEMFSSNQWFFISFGLFLLFLVATFLFIFASSVRLRKVSFYMGALFITVCLVFLTFSHLQKSEQVNHRGAIIMNGVVVVKSSPDKSGTDLFQLHEGTKVSIKSTLDKWVEIKLSNGNVGWVEQSMIEQI